MTSSHTPQPTSQPVRHTPDSPVAQVEIGSAEHAALLGSRERIQGTHEGREYSITGPVDTDPSHRYPKVDCHIWGAFALLAIEMGGYGDLEAVDPYSGRRFWLANAFKLSNGEPANGYQAIQNLIGAMEAAGFMSEGEQVLPPPGA